MSYLLEKAREKVKKIKEELKDYDISDSWKECLEAQLVNAEKEVEKLEKYTDFDKVAAEMKIINNHVKAVDDKYNCKTVKFLYSIADFFDNLSLTKPLATKIREYIVTKINAPVCSILGNERPELGEMPKHMTPAEDSYIEWKRRDREELSKFRDISVKYFETKDKMTFIDKVRQKLRAI